MVGRFKKMWAWHMRYPLRRGCLAVAALVLGVPCSLIALFVLFLGPFSPSPVTAVEAYRFPVSFMKGVAYESWWTGEYQSPLSDETLRSVIQPTGTNWISLIVKCTQASLTTTDIVCDTTQTTATDAELDHVIQYAHQVGLKVMLKPHIDLIDPTDATVGRYKINYGTDETAWRTWFDNYTRFITHYADLAERNGVDYFVVGTELTGTTGRDNDWRELIAQIRGIYHGPLTYAALTYLEPQIIRWWDALDAIGVDAYYGVTFTTQPTLAQLELGWKPNVLLLENLASRWNKPIILTEVGYLSVDGTNRAPGYWAMDTTTDPQEQADCYQALFNVLQGKPWLAGIFWWSYSTKPDQGGLTDRTYTPHGKPAEAVLRRYYG